MRKVIIIAISSCIVLLLLGFAGYRGYKSWKEQHLVSLAKTFAEQGDGRNEQLSLQQVLAMNPRNVEACRRMAALAEAARSPETLSWRQRVVDLAPDSTDDRLALVQTAMRMGDFASATNTLAGVSAEGKKTALYHNVSGTIAAALNHLAEAQGHFAEAIRLDPSNPVPKVNLSVMQLQSTNSPDAAGARIELKDISQNSTNASIRILALRELVKDSLRQTNAALSLTLVAELARQTNATFDDKLMRLDILGLQNHRDLPSALSEYQREAVTNFASLAQMGNWMMQHTNAATTLKWLHTLPADTQTNPPACMLIAECQVIEKNWSGLENSLKNQNWNDMDFIRHAMLSRALRGQGMTAGSTAEWEVASNLADKGQTAGQQKSRLIRLFGLARGWGWDDKAEQLLWTIVNRYPEEKGAGAVLQQYLVLNGRTSSLMQYLTLQSKRTPHDLVVLNDLAMTAMLLDAQEIIPFDLAQKVYEQSPTNTSFASTYAFALYQQKQYSKAIAVLEKLTPEELGSPAVAGYYGLVLKAAGETARANDCLKAALSEEAKTKVILLPEERKLFENALK